MLPEASVKAIYPSLTRTDNFSSFWNQTLEQLNSVPYAIEITDHQETDDGLRLQYVTFQSLDKVFIRGYLLTPDTGESNPLVVYTHGYMGQCEIVWTWAKQGISVFGLDVRGFGQSKDAVTDISKYGYIISGIQSEKTSILRGAVCDYIRGIQVANELVSNNQESTVLYGKSFGGALACMGAALTDYADYLVAAVPTFAWAEGRRRLVMKGSGAEINDYLKHHPERVQQTMRVLSYFDTMNFAPMINCNALIGLGLKDPVVPAETVYAFINHLQCKKEIREFPVSHSSSPQETLWDNFEKEWIQLVKSGKF